MLDCYQQKIQKIAIFDILKTITLGWGWGVGGGEEGWVNMRTSKNYPIVLIYSLGSIHWYVSL